MAAIQNVLLAALLLIVPLAASAVEILTIHSPKAIALELLQKQQWQRLSGEQRGNLDLQIRLHHEAGQLAPQAWLSTPQIPGHQWAITWQDGATLSKASGTIAWYPTRWLKGREAAVLFSGTSNIELTMANVDSGKGKISLKHQPNRSSEFLTETAIAFGLVEAPGRAQKRRNRSPKSVFVAQLPEKGKTTAFAVSSSWQGPRRAQVASDGQHPRLLFTADDVPRVRQWAEGKVGKMVIGRLEALLQLAEDEGFEFHQGGEHSMHSYWAAGYGLLYQLTGEVKYALRAEEWAWYGMSSTLPDKNQWRQSHRILGVALAYDLCYEAWTENMRAHAYHYLLRQALLFAQRDDVLDPLQFGTRFVYQNETRPRIRSADSIEPHRYVGSALLAALAIKGDPVPSLFNAGSEGEVRSIEPAVDYQPAIGVPVVTLQHQQMFSRWLINGPFRIANEDPLQAQGGFSHRPQPGEQLKSEGVPVDWRIYYPADGYSGGRGPVFYPRNCMKYVTKATGMGYPPGREVAAILRKEHPLKKRARVAVTMYTVWDNRDDRLIMAEPNWQMASHGVRMWINGEEVRDGDVLAVKPGLYPVMVWMPIMGGYNRQAPHLREVSQQELQQQSQAGANRQQQVNDLTTWLAGALREQLHHFTLAMVDDIGTGASDIAEHALPALIASARHDGIDWLAQTGFAAVSKRADITAPYLGMGSMRFQFAQLAGYVTGDQRTRCVVMARRSKFSAQATE